MMDRDRCQYNNIISIISKQEIYLTVFIVSAKLYVSAIYLTVLIVSAQPYV